MGMQVLEALALPKGTQGLGSGTSTWTGQGLLISRGFQGCRPLCNRLSPAPVPYVPGLSPRQSSSKLTPFLELEQPHSLQYNKTVPSSTCVAQSR